MDAWGFMALSTSHVISYLAAKKREMGEMDKTPLFNIVPGPDPTQTQKNWFRSLVCLPLDHTIHSKQDDTINRVILHFTLVVVRQ